MRDGVLGNKAIVRREPIGVAGAIVPWNVPLFVTMLKLGPALAAGATVVVKPAPETPLDGILLAEVLREAGLPPGVVNIVPAGREVGEHLVTHPDVDKIGFTGIDRRRPADRGALRRAAQALHARAGRQVGRDHPRRRRPVADDSRPHRRVPDEQRRGVRRADAHPRVEGPVPRGGGRALRDGRAAARRRSAGSDRRVGPLVAERQRQRVEGYIERGRAEGATVALGGGRPKDLRRGWYVEPTVFANVDNRMTIAREEIFGPVLAVIPYDAPDDAVRIANDSDYGLSGSVWTSDPAAGLAVARRVRTGTYTVNGLMLEFTCPFGGYKQSGMGRELGPEGLEAYLETKSISLPVGFVPEGV